MAGLGRDERNAPAPGRGQGRGDLARDMAALPMPVTMTRPGTAGAARAPQQRALRARSTAVRARRISARMTRRATARSSLRLSRYRGPPEPSVSIGNSQPPPPESMRSRHLPVRGGCGVSGRRCPRYPSPPDRAARVGRKSKQACASARGPRAPAWHRAARAGHADAARRRPHRPVAPR